MFICYTIGAALRHYSFIHKVHLPICSSTVIYWETDWEVLSLNPTNITGDFPGLIHTQGELVRLMGRLV